MSRRSRRDCFVQVCFVTISFRHEKLRTYGNIHTVHVGYIRSHDIHMNTGIGKTDVQAHCNTSMQIENDTAPHLLVWLLFAPLPKLYAANFRSSGLCRINMLSVNGKQPIKGIVVDVFSYSIQHLIRSLTCFHSLGFVFDSFRFVWFCFRLIFAHSVIHSVNRFVFITFHSIQLNSISIIVFKVISTIVYLLYTCLTGCTVHLPHDFVFFAY